ncbi:MAG: glutathione S-transferase family protein [Deltaproteobacteria bacterium]|nr:MAG: glutathione S-transferase family protein [Deltaproteobacteria bacterium]
MPVLVDGEVVVYESAIINEYLEERYPEPSLMPKSLGLRARARIWIDFCNTRLQAAGGDVAHGREVETAKEKLREHLKTLDKQMAGRNHLIGDYSLADITYVPFFTRQQRYGVTIDQSFPNLKQWLDRLLSRPAVKSTL